MPRKPRVPYLTATQREKAKRKPGRPPFTPTKAQRLFVALMTAFKIRQSIMCELVGVSIATLHRSFPEELADGQLILRAKLGAELIHIAFDRSRRDQFPALKHALSVAAGVTERTQAEVTVKSVKEMSADELERLIAHMEQAEAVEVGSDIAAQTPG